MPKEKSSADTGWDLRMQTVDLVSKGFTGLYQTWPCLMGFKQSILGKVNAKKYIIVSRKRSVQIVDT